VRDPSCGCATYLRDLRNLVLLHAMVVRQQHHPLLHAVHRVRVRALRQALLQRVLRALRPRVVSSGRGTHCGGGLGRIVGRIGVAALFRHILWRRRLAFASKGRDQNC
jgi:hypothetical protein